jgi:tRNA(fMet)-specific endonuclease VapC
MDKCLLDTDIFSEILRGVNRNVMTKTFAYRAAFLRYTISVITVVEIVKGLHRLGREERIQQFLGSMPALELLVLDLDSAELAGRI